MGVVDSGRHIALPGRVDPLKRALNRGRRAFPGLRRPASIDNPRKAPGGLFV